MCDPMRGSKVHVCQYCVQAVGSGAGSRHARLQDWWRQCIIRAARADMWIMIREVNCAVIVLVL